MLGVDAVTLNKVVSDVDSITDLRLRETILFALKCSRSPQSLKEIDYQRLRKFGFKQSEVMELIAMSALSVYANIIADATAMPPDKMFATL
jgi:alkylhydroperoxidase family enzyme